MKLAANIAGILLGLIFNVVAWNFFLHFFSMPEPPAQFLGAMIPTGYFVFVKILEITGGILVVIPRTRPLGLLTLGPILVNILCFHTFLARGAGLIGLPLLVAALALFLLWSERAAFSHLLPAAKGTPATQHTRRVC